MAGHPGAAVADMHTGHGLDAVVGSDRHHPPGADGVAGHPGAAVATAVSFSLVCFSLI